MDKKLEAWRIHLYTTRGLEKTSHCCCHFGWSILVW